MTRAVLALLGAVGCATSPPAPIGNVAARPRGPQDGAQRVGVLVLGELGHCPIPHPLVLLLDGQVRARVSIVCRPPPKPNAQGITVITTDDEPSFTAPPFAIPRGHHALTARDELTGLTETVEGDFPVHGQLERIEPTAPLADTVFVLVHEDWIQVDVLLRANLVMM